MIGGIVSLGLVIGAGAEAAAEQGYWFVRALVDGEGGGEVGAFGVDDNDSVEVLVVDEALVLDAAQRLVPAQHTCTTYTAHSTRHTAHRRQETLAQTAVRKA